MTPITDIVARYFQAWNAADLAESLGALEDACTPEVDYTDPGHACRSARDLAAHIQQTRVAAPSFHVEVISAIDGYESRYRYAWLFEADGLARFPGLDVITIGADGKITRITSFFGELASAEGHAELLLQPRFGASSP